MVLLNVVGRDSPVELQDFRAIVAGYTGRDQEAVNDHIRELAEIGVPAPPRTPMFYDVDSSAVSTDEQISVQGEYTSGEVEPVYLRISGEYYLGVGSDHTDRQLETEDIAESKKVCPKPLGATVVPIEDIDALELDDYVATTFADGVPYQHGNLSGLMNPRDVLVALAEEQELGDGDFVVLGGTIPLADGGFKYAKKWEMRIEPKDNPAGGSEFSLNHTYETRTKG